MEFQLVLAMIVMTIIIAIVLFGITYYLNPKKDDLEKLSAYECGFDPFSDSRTRFDVRFYLVSILFIIFDLEIMFFFPWALVLDQIGLFGFFVGLYFLIILTVGFAYEWLMGALDWD
jgi:NADH:ubiquinone oxidoreductase subunit 3 (subunit A)